jgi:pimeloyl-ACP methyl ester carboxylesterase
VAGLHFIAAKKLAAAGRKSLGLGAQPAYHRKVTPSSATKLAMLLLLASSAGCATRDTEFAADLETSRLPRTDTALRIEGLGPCTDNPDRTLYLDGSQPVSVLVHGCYGSSGQFRALAQVLAFHGQQSACFTYDDRARLADSGAELTRALVQLAEHSQVPQITVIGHSQGSLVARRAVAQPLQTPLQVRPVPLRLVTVSGPFSGIESARPCGVRWLRPLTLGLLPLSCYVTTGAKWTDITYSSDFLLAPGLLAPHVVSHLKIDTDERQTCRRREGERCVETDDVFSLTEQRSVPVEADARVTRVEVSAGHVEIVGDKRVAPTKLIEILQQQGVVRATEPQRRAAFERWLAWRYGD